MNWIENSQHHFETQEFVAVAFLLSGFSSFYCIVMFHSSLFPGVCVCVCACVRACVSYHFCESPHSLSLSGLTWFFWCWTHKTSSLTGAWQHTWYLCIIKHRSKKKKSIWYGGNSTPILYWQNSSLDLVIRLCIFHTRTQLDFGSWHAALCTLTVLSWCCFLVTASICLVNVWCCCYTGHDNPQGLHCLCSCLR